MNRIKEVREQRHISQNKLAKAAGISQPFLCDLERNYRCAKPETLQRIADCMEIPVAELEG